MSYRKIKDLKKGIKKGTYEQTEKRRVASQNAGLKNMIKNNPMKNPEIAKKNVEARRKRGTLKFPAFKKGNKLSRFKGKKHSEKAKMIISIKNTGRKVSKENKERMKEKMIKNNPMKNPEIVKRYKEKRAENKKIRTREKQRKSALNNENIKKSQFLPRVLITETLKEQIITLYSNNWSIQRIADEISMHVPGVRKILIASGINIRNGKTPKEITYVTAKNGHFKNNNNVQKEVIK